MCDYSLYAFNSRLAQDGEELTVYRFPTGSLGFAASCDVAANLKRRNESTTVWSAFKEWLSPRKTCVFPAVCVPPGARLLLTDVPRSLQIRFGISVNEPVTFAQRSSQMYTYRDCVRLMTGAQILLQELPEGLRAVVVSTVYEEPAVEVEITAVGDEISRAL
ncbi:MAG TPA: hypothetical protein VG168_16960 [Bryobacteraceae bacterium]|nr:hypothetical protein [Bryobacteraceae bacterium]